MRQEYTISLKDLGIKDVGLVGGKNASLGEMISSLSSLGVVVPDGFAVTTKGFYDFLDFNNLTASLENELRKLDRASLSNLGQVSRFCKQAIASGSIPKNLGIAIDEAYRRLGGESNLECAVAVRSSATAEDSLTASFAGQHDSFLNVIGSKNVQLAIRDCYASLFNERAIKYRIDHGFSDLQVAISACVQRMVRSDLGSAGVAFTIDPESGNDNVIYVTGAWGLGESVVQGAVNTDEFYLFKNALTENKQAVVYRKLGEKNQMVVYDSQHSGKTSWIETTAEQRDRFVLSDHELSDLGRWCVAIEDHYAAPMDIEWAKDGETNKLFIVQARPETIHSGQRQLKIKEYLLRSKETPILTGKAVGRSVVSGRVVIVRSLADSAKVQEGDIIVADITNPDWNALLKKAVSIVTNKGGRTSHASIIARELGIPAIVGTLHATERLHDGQIITVSCASGDEGSVFEGKLAWTEQEVALDSIPATNVKPMFILADPAKALMYSLYPSNGVGLLRMEFIITNSLQIHPMALVKYAELPDSSDKRQIEALTRRYTDKKSFFVEHLGESLALVAAAFYPRDVIVRMSDFKTNEYATLIGGKYFEPTEENPMLGFRGASRYYHEKYQEGFALECAAVRKARDEMGLTNIKIMIPFCRTIQEAQKVQQVMKDAGLQRGKNALEIYVMAEIPSNILLAGKFAELFDGFSIGSNDLTQLTLGLDRDSAIVSNLFDENNEAVTMQIKHLIEVAHNKGVKVGLCGQAPSDYPAFSRFLVESGIDSISFNPDALVRGIKNIAEAETQLHAQLI